MTVTHPCRTFGVRVTDSKNTLFTNRKDDASSIKRASGCITPPALFCSEHTVIVYSENLHVCVIVHASTFYPTRMVQAFLFRFSNRSWRKLRSCCRVSLFLNLHGTESGHDFLFLLLHSLKGRMYLMRPPHVSHASPFAVSFKN